MTRITTTLAVLAAFTWTGLSAAAEVMFWGQRDYAIVSPHGVVIGDFNGDGKSDIVVANYLIASVTLLLNGGVVRTIPVGGYPATLSIGDLNGDSRMDVVVGGTPDFVVLLGDAEDGLVSAGELRPIGGGIVIEEFDDDDNADIAFATMTGVALLLGNGDGTFRAGERLDFEETHTLAAGDFNGDARMDIAAGAPGRIAVLPGKGDGTFLPPIHTAPDQGSLRESGDFNGDGRLDLVVELSDRVGILIGNGDGTFQPPIGTSETFDTMRSFAVGDFNEDSKLDLTISTSGPVVVLFGMGDGRLERQVHVVASGLIAVGDLNGDSHVDLAIATACCFSQSYDQIGRLSLRFGYGDGTFAETPGLQAPILAAAVTAADFNGDSAIDVAVGLSDTRGLSYMAVILGNGNGTFKPSPSTLPISFNVRSTVANDFDHDSHVDLLALAESPEPPGIFLFKGRGDGSLAPPELVAAVSRATVLVTEDLNADGSLDVVIGTGPGGDFSVVMMIGNGNGTFQPPIAVVSDVSSVREIQINDLNADGLPDLAVGTISGLWIVRGNGQGMFQPPMRMGFGVPNSIAVADLNADGRMDLVRSSGQRSPNVSVLLGAGDGTFQPGGDYDTPSSGLVRAADFNGDGRTDVAVLSGDDSLWILIGKGDGTLQLQATGFSTVSGARGMAVADFTSDARPDVAIAGDGRPGVDVEAVAIALLYNVTPPSDDHDTLRPSAARVSRTMEYVKKR